jgi:hypothetical protein
VFLELVMSVLQAQLSPIAAAFSMDPVERALRVGGEREVAKKSEEEAGTIAGEGKQEAGCCGVYLSTREVGRAWQVVKEKARKQQANSFEAP